MKNQEIADIFYQIADMLEILDVPFKPQAYRRAAMVLESLPEDVEKIYKSKGVKGIEEIPGIGKNLSKKIIEYVETGKIKKLEELKKKVPGDLVKIMNIKGIGPKKVKAIYNTLKITTVEEFKKACIEHKIRRLKGFGEKTEKLILEGLKNLEERRFLLGITLPMSKSIIELLKPYVNKIEVAGSIRRRKETNGDIDILATSTNPKKAMDIFVKMNDVERILAHGETKSSVILKNGIQVDLRIVKDDEFGSALQYFTGSKSHNIRLREIAIKKGMKLNEYGLFKGEKKIAGNSEKEVYKKLGLQFVPPEMRENLGEVELAQSGKLPKLIGYGDIKGDTHVHTKWSDGTNTIIEMAEYAKKLGYEYIVITDHYGLKYANGLDEKRILEQIKKIESLNDKVDIRIFSGVEANILEDGSIDVPKEVLKRLDFVVAAIHSKFSLPKVQQTARLIKAIENPYVKAIAHPTGRLIFKRKPIEVDMEKVFETAAKNDTLMEINASIDRLDLNDSNIKLAKEFGVKFVIGTDSHTDTQMNYMEFGIATARRGWAEKKDVINTLDLKRFERAIK